MTPVMRLLIADHVRRSNRWMLLFFAAFVVGMWSVGVYSDQPSRAFATSMWFAAQAGPQQILWLVPRPLWYLPVSRRDVWRSGWLLCAIGIPALALAVKLLAALVSGKSAPGIGSIALSTVFDVATAGLGCGLVILVTHPRPETGPLRLPAAVVHHIAQICLPSNGFVLYAAAQWNNAVPTHWSELSAATTAGLAAAIALTVATYFYVPTPATLSNRVASARRSRPAAVRDSRLTGIPRLLLREAGWTLTLGGSLVLVAVAILMVVARVAQDESGFAHTLRSLLMNVAVAGSPAHDIGLIAFNLVVWYGVFAASMATRFSQVMRHLRVLPIGPVRLNALLVGWTPAIWLFAWAAATLLRYAVLGYLPARPPFAPTVAIMGICALAQAGILRVAALTRAILFGVAAGLVPFLSMTKPLSPLLLIGVGIVSLAAAIVINHDALSRSSTYRATRFPIGTVPTR
jgi:hypothetical protein